MITLFAVALLSALSWFVFNHASVKVGYSHSWSILAGLFNAAAKLAAVTCFVCCLMLMFCLIGICL
jgi:hypothetical protein